MATQLFTIAILISGLIACKNEPTSELERTRQALESRKKELRERQEINQMQAELKTLDAELRSINDLSDRKATQGIVMGYDVVFRQNASALSEKIDHFNNGEVVTILQKHVSLNDNRAVLSRNIEMSENVVFNKGDALTINRYHPENDTYDIAIQHPEQGEMTANLPAFVVEKTINDNWYQIRRSNGGTGWVFGKFLTEI